MAHPAPRSLPNYPVPDRANHKPNVEGKPGRD
jgi:hypothetical protein